MVAFGGALPRISPEGHALVEHAGVAQRLEIPESKVLNNIQRLGNCSAAALPILLAEASREGHLRPGELVSLTAFGSGFTWGSALLRWG